MKFVNLTPHTITFVPDPCSPDCDYYKQIIPASGMIARVDNAPGQAANISPAGHPWLFEAHTQGALYLNEPECDFPKPGDMGEGAVLIVSSIVLAHPSIVGRRDVVAPGTGPQDGAIRFPATVEAETWISAKVASPTIGEAWPDKNDEVLTISAPDEEGGRMVKYRTRPANSGQIRAVTRFILPPSA